jgi:hypothetical protein
VQVSTYEPVVMVCELPCRDASCPAPGSPIPSPTYSPPPTDTPSPTITPSGGGSTATTSSSPEGASVLGAATPSPPPPPPSPSYDDSYYDSDNGSGNGDAKLIAGAVLGVVAVVGGEWVAAARLQLKVRECEVVWSGWGYKPVRVASASRIVSKAVGRLTCLCLSQGSIPYIEFSRAV